MTTSSISPQPWEIWLAYVHFIDHPDVGKVRPVVILDEETTAIVVAKVTTSDPNDGFTYCELLDWESEGLVKPSRVQLSPLFEVAKPDILNDAPLGILSARDRARLERAFDSA